MVSAIDKVDSGQYLFVQIAAFILLIEKIIVRKSRNFIIVSGASFKYNNQFVIDYNYYNSTDNYIIFTVFIS